MKNSTPMILGGSVLECLGSGGGSWGGRLSRGEWGGKDLPLSEGFPTCENLILPSDRESRRCLHRDAESGMRMEVEIGDISACGARCEKGRRSSVNTEVELDLSIYPPSVSHGVNRMKRGELDGNSKATMKNAVLRSFRC